MILTSKTLDQYLERTQQTITRKTYQQILDYFSEEPGDGQIWTEQDLWEQVRKQIICVKGE